MPIRSRRDLRCKFSDNCRNSFHRSARNRATDSPIPPAYFTAIARVFGRGPVRRNAATAAVPAFIPRRADFVVRRGLHCRAARSVPHSRLAAAARHARAGLVGRGLSDRRVLAGAVGGAAAMDLAAARSSVRDDLRRLRHDLERRAPVPRPAACCRSPLSPARLVWLVLASCRCSSSAAPSARCSASWSSPPIRSSSPSSCRASGANRSIRAPRRSSCRACTRRFS